MENNTQNSLRQDLLHRMFVICNALMRLADRTTALYAEDVRRRCAQMDTLDSATREAVSGKHFVELADSGLGGVVLEDWMVYLFVGYVAKAYKYEYAIRLRWSIQAAAMDYQPNDGAWKNAIALQRAVSSVRFD